MMKFLRKYWFIILTIVILVISSIIGYQLSIKYEYDIKTLYSDKELNYNIITFNSVLAGFLFSGISVLLSLIENPSIKRLWDQGYLDCMYHSGAAGIISSVFSIILAFTSVIQLPFINENQFLLSLLTIIELTLSIGCLVFFLYCVKRLMNLIKTIRKQKKIISINNLSENAKN